MLPSRFYRKREAIELSGYGYVEFHEAQKDGRFPKPDAYLGPRSPVWSAETLYRWQQATLAAGKATTSSTEAA